MLITHDGVLVRHNTLGRSNIDNVHCVLVIDLGGFIYILGCKILIPQVPAATSKRHGGSKIGQTHHKSATMILVRRIYLTPARYEQGFEECLTGTLCLKINIKLWVIAHCHFKTHMIFLIAQFINIQFVGTFVEFLSNHRKPSHELFFHPLSGIHKCKTAFYASGEAVHRQASRVSAQPKVFHHERNIIPYIIDLIIHQ